VATGAVTTGAVTTGAYAVTGVGFFLKQLKQSNNRHACTVAGLASEAIQIDPLTTALPIDFRSITRSPAPLTFTADIWGGRIDYAAAHAQQISPLTWRIPCRQSAVPRWPV
jgi:hypothetical protein